jgi:hypothetical protein
MLHLKEERDIRPLLRNREFSGSVGKGFEKVYRWECADGDD